MVEGGQRENQKGCVIYKDKKIIKYKPLNDISNELEQFIINKFNIQLCKLYFNPFNFDRTGCKGCPFNINIQDSLNILREKLPNEYKVCNNIFGKVYDEYRRVGYRLNKENDYYQLNMFDKEGDN